MNPITSKERAEIAAALGIDCAYLYQVLSGRREMEAEAAVDVERRSGMRLRRWHLRTKSWHRIWPELIGADGAPAVPAGQVGGVHAGSVENGAANVHTNSEAKVV